MALVLGAVVVRVADEIRLPVVVEISIADGHVVRGVRHVQQAVVVVLVVRQVRRQVAVVDPNVLRGLDADGIAVLRQHLGHAQVAHDDVLDLVDVHADADQLCKDIRRREVKGGIEEKEEGDKGNGFRTGAALANDRRVAANADLGGAGDGAADDNDLGAVAGNGRGILGQGGDGCDATSGSALGATV